VLHFEQLNARRFPAAAVAELYDPPRAAQIQDFCLPQLTGSGEKHVAPLTRPALAAVWHAEWPAVRVAQWFLWMDAHDGVAILLLLGAIGIGPVAFCARDKAPARLIVVWLAVGGFLGLAGLLALMLLLETLFGSLYLLAGLCSSLYLSGMFAGNRLAEVKLLPTARRPDAAMFVWQTMMHGMLLLLLFFVKWLGSPSVAVLACFVAGVPAGAYVPLAVAQLRAWGAERMLGATVIGSDAIGSAVGCMLMSLLLLPWMGVFQACLAVIIFATGLGFCALAKEGQVRCVARSAGLACVILAILLAIAPLGRADATTRPPARIQLIFPRMADDLARVASAGAVFFTNLPVHTNVSTVKETAPPVGNPRSVDMEGLRNKQAKGELSTHPADFYYSAKEEQR